MPFQEDLTEFLDIEQGFAVGAKITPTNGGLPYEIRGIFTNDYYAIDAGAAGIAGANPTFECAQEEVEEIEYGDLLTFQRKIYRIAEIKPDGTGWVALVLERQG